MVGEIKCRLKEKSKQIKGLSDFLKTFFRGGFKPTFDLELEHGPNHEVPTPKDTLQPTSIVINEKILEEMRARDTFSLPLDDIVICATATIHISLCLQQEMTYSNGEHKLSISGSPRSLDMKKLVEEELEGLKSPGDI